jgi:hypothetical protein
VASLSQIQHMSLEPSSAPTIARVYVAITGTGILGGVYNARGVRTFSWTAAHFCARRACIYSDGRESQIGSSGPLATMMQPSESFVPKDATGSCRADPSPRPFFLKSQMGAILVVIAHTIRDQALQVSLVQTDHVIQQIAPATLDPALRHSVLSGTLIGR